MGAGGATHAQGRFRARSRRRNNGTSLPPRHALAPSRAPADRDLALHFGWVAPEPGARPTLRLSLKGQPVTVREGRDEVHEMQLNKMGRDGYPFKARA